MELDALRATVAEISSELDLSQLLHSIVKRAATLLNASGGEIGLFEESSKQILIVVGHNLGQDFTGVRVSLGEGLLGRVAETRKPLIVKDYMKWRGRSEKFLGATLRAAMASPLLIGGQLLGVIAIVRADNDQGFTKNDQTLLQMFAQQAAIAVKNAELFNELEKLTRTDTLTGLFNRRGLIEMSQSEFERAKRSGYPLSMIMVDIDFFKLVNDQYGHTVGDQILRILSDELQRNLRGIDILCRYGGEEFAILLPETTLQSAREVAERLRVAAVKLQFTSIHADINITISLGISTMPGDTADLETLLDQADEALYSAKTSGRNRVCIYGEPNSELIQEA